MESSSTLTVSIEGAVAFPGLYTLAKGSILADLLQMVEPSKKADLADFDAKHPLREGEHIVVPEKRNIRVFVQGAVPHPRPYEIEEGMTMGQFLRTIELSSEAVTYSLPKRQVLQEGQVIQVPSRKRGRKSLS
ncbi:MAG: SLBB domain-containing protein [Verrucomicrobia bacterium]|nr:SLBB domain-containing protein [Verrucomicrobiota bacterium]